MTSAGGGARGTPGPVDVPRRKPNVRGIGEEVPQNFSSLDMPLTIPYSQLLSAGTNPPVPGKPAMPLPEGV